MPCAVSNGGVCLATSMFSTPSQTAHVGAPFLFAMLIGPIPFKCSFIHTKPLNTTAGKMKELTISNERTDGTASTSLDENALLDLMCAVDGSVAALHGLQNVESLTLQVGRFCTLYKRKFPKKLMYGKWGEAHEWIWQSW